MKNEEKIAQIYLERCGYDNIIFEPDGNIPPDFAINRNVAIEVRRLNQHHQTNGRAQPLEQLEFSLIPKIRSLLNNITFESEHSHSYFVFIQFSRPIGNAKKLLKKVTLTLEEHLQTSVKEKTRYLLNDNFSLEVFPSSKKYPQPYLLGGYIDIDSGGFIVSEIYKNLKIIIEEKTRKIAPYKSNYQEWWLLLIDYIGIHLSAHDANQLSEIFNIEHQWDKIILVSPIEPYSGIEIFSILL